MAETIKLVVHDMEGHIVHFTIRSTTRMGLVFAAFGKRAKWGRAVQVDLIKPTLKAPGTKRVNMINCCLICVNFASILLSISTCVATPR